MFLFAAMLPAGSAQQAPPEWAGVAQQLTRRVVGITGQSPVSLTFENLARVSPQALADFSNALMEQLRLAGARPSTRAGAAYDVRVTISENARETVFAAETADAKGEVQVALLTAPRKPVSNSAATTVLLLQKALLVRQELPVLDAQMLNPQTLVVLDQDRITTYGRQPSGWESIASAEVTPHHSMPRDLRGRLAIRPDGLEAYLPGTVCSSASLAPLTVTCRDSDDPWALTSGSGAVSAFYNAARNFFTGVLVPGERVAPFYSAAVFGERSQWVFAAVKRGECPAEGSSSCAGAHPWGSGIQALRACGADLILAGGAEDYGRPDALRAYSEAREPVSDPVEFSGPVVELWSAPDRNSVTAVARNLQTGNYEAYSITAACHE